LHIKHLFTARVSLGVPEKASPEKSSHKRGSHKPRSGKVTPEVMFFFVGEKEILKIDHRVLCFCYLIVFVFDFASKWTIIIVLYLFFYGLSEMTLLVFISLFLLIAELMLIVHTKGYDHI